MTFSCFRLVLLGPVEKEGSIKNFYKCQESTLASTYRLGRRYLRSTGTSGEAVDPIRVSLKAAAANEAWKF
jgi:hypothetical protein